MDLNKIKKVRRGKRHISVYVNEAVWKWLKQKGYAPNRIFIEALKDIKCPYVKESD